MKEILTTPGRAHSGSGAGGGESMEESLELSFED